MLPSKLSDTITSSSAAFLVAVGDLIEVFLDPHHAVKRTRRKQLPPKWQSPSQQTQTNENFSFSQESEDPILSFFRSPFNFPIAQEDKASRRPSQAEEEEEDSMVTTADEKEVGSVNNSIVSTCPEETHQGTSSVTTSDVPCKEAASLSKEDEVPSPGSETTTAAPRSCGGIQSALSPLQDICDCNVGFSFKLACIFCHPSWGQD